jgi:hypothetical protein
MVAINGTSGANARSRRRFFGYFFSKKVTAFA